jgi:hypothetical protein
LASSSCSSPPGFSLALASTALSARFPLARPAIFLFAAALASDLFPSLAEPLTLAMSHSLHRT